MTPKEERQKFIEQVRHASESMINRHMENPDRYGLVLSFHQDPILVRTPDGPPFYKMGPRVTTLTLTEHITREEIIESKDI